MKRLQQGSRIIYLERHLGRSLVLFLGSLALLALAAFFQPAEIAPLTWTFVGGSVCVATIALWYVLEAHVLVIDREERMLTVITRRPPFRTERQSSPFESLEVRVENRFVLQEHTGRYGEITSRTGLVRQDVLIVFDGHRRLIVERDLPAPAGATFGQQLACEMGCPFVS